MMARDKEYAQCHLCLVSQIKHFLLSAIILNVVMLNVVAPRD